MSKYFDNKQIFHTPITTQYGNNMVMTNPNKTQSKKQYINIDTRFSNETKINTNTANYNITLPLRLTNVKSISITNVEMPVTYYNISSTLNNNTFRITNQTTKTSTTIILPDNQYTNTTLQTAISSLLPSGITFTINSNGQSVFSTTIPFYIEFYTDSNGAYDKTNPKFKLGWLLGYRIMAYPILPSIPFVSETSINLSGPRYIYLVLDEFQNGKENTFQSLVSCSMLKKNIIARITPSPTEYPYGTILPANLSNGKLTTDKRTYKGQIDIQRLNIQLVNEIGQLIPLNGGYIMFCLEVE
jgi:hypothetical protein